MTETDVISQTRQVYETTASDYAAKWFDCSVMEPLLSIFVDTLGEPKTVLDAGCGPGRDVQAMAKQNIDVAGIDCCKAMIREARARVPNCCFMQMDMRRLNYPPEIFSGVWSCASIHHIPYEEIFGVLSEFVRILRTGGILALSVELGEGDYIDDIGRYIKRYTESELAQLLQRAGFGSIKRYCLTDALARPKKWLNVIAKKTQYLAGGLDNRDCIFCPDSRFDLNHEMGLAGVGSVLWANENFYLTPDIAPLVEGHLLLTSINHHVCFGDMPVGSVPAINNAKNYVRSLFNKAYNATTIFMEHGPAQCGMAGACVDHAHLHCLPCDLQIRKTLEKHLGSGKCCSIGDLAAIHDAGQSYVYIEESDGKEWVYPTDVIPSQFLRQVIAKILDKPTWRWQDDCRSNNVQRVFNATLRHLSACVPQVSASRGDTNEV
ncbi:MAG: methyltransferase domain-containing protein [Armatimonadota bacterium]|nr:methyltransferase domain-containing protein [bacterium]